MQMVFLTLQCCVYFSLKNFFDEDFRGPKVGGRRRGHEAARHVGGGQQSHDRGRGQLRTQEARYAQLQYT